MAWKGSAGDDEVHLHLLVLRCQAGDERAFRELFETFSGQTMGYLRGLVGESAEDVQQEVWLAAFRNVASLANPAAFRTWLFRIARFRALDLLRRFKREGELLAPTPLESVDVAADAEETGLGETALASAIETLPAPQREALLLRYQQNLSYAEIALITAVPIGTVRTRIHHGKRKLHDLLGGLDR